MSWSNKRVYGFIVGTMLAGSVIVGCAGDATVGPNPGTPTIPANGGVTQNMGSSNESRAASESPQQVQVTVNGQSVTGFIPGGEGINTGETVNLIRGGTPLLNGLAAVGRAPGDVKLRRNGQGAFFNSGVRLLGDGSLSGNLILRSGNWEAFVEGPLRLSLNGNTLSIGSFIMQGVVRNGVDSLPIAIGGNFPVNGGSSFPLTLDVQNDAEFPTGTVSLRITHANGVLFQQHALVNGHAQFHDLTVDGNSQIPPTGVQTVEYRYFLP